MKPIRRRFYALCLVGVLLVAGLCGCRMKSVSGQMKELYGVYMDSVIMTATAPDYENFRRIFPLNCWNTWKESVFGGSESDMKFHFEENITKVKEEYGNKCGLDSTYTVENIEHTNIEGEELENIKKTLQDSFEIDPGEVRQVCSVTVTIVLQGSMDTVTITHKQRLMRMNGQWYFCPVSSQDPFHLFD